MHAAAARSPISWQLLTFCQLQFRRGGHLHDWMLAADAVREAANELGDTQGQLLAIIAQATSRHYASRYADAVAFAGHARALAAELGDRSREASAATVAGLAHWQGGQLTEASHDFADVVERIDPQTSPAMLAVALNNIGMIEQERGYVSRAMSNYRQALEINQRIRRQAGIVSNLANIAWASFDSNDFAESAATYVSALTELSTQQHVAGEAIIREDYTYTLLALDRVDEAAEQAGAAYEAAARANDPRMQASTAIAVASVQRRQGRYEEAMAHLKQAYATATELQSRRPMAMAQIELARLACAREKPGDAIIHGRQAHDIAAAAGFGLLVAHAHVVLATAMRAAGHLLQAAEHDELAMRQRAQLGLAPKDNGSPLGPAVARQAHDNRWPPTGAIAPVGEPVEQRTRPHRSS
jgi:tetratricopeptide (TPR) repeat protein